MGVLKKKWKLIAIIAGVVAVIVLMFVFIAQGIQNTAFKMEESVKTARADITIQEQRRVELIYMEMAECVVQYDAHEASLFKMMAEGSATDKTIDTAQVRINDLVKKYPEIKSNENYKTIMTEMSISANAITDYRENYNKQVRNYNHYVKKFPNRLFLSMCGYEEEEYQLLEFEGTQTLPDSVFGNNQ